MKVLHVHGHDFWWPLPDGAATRLRGGVEVYLAGLLPALEQRGCSVTVLRCSALPPPPDSTRPGRFYELRQSGLRYRRSTGAGLARILREVRPDLVHLHSVYYALHPRMVAWLLASCPVIYTLHDVDPICFRKTKLHRDGTPCSQPIGLACVTSGCHRLHERRGWARGMADLLLSPRQLVVYRQLPTLLVPSNYLREQLILNGFDAQRIRVLPNFTRYPPRAPSPLPSRHPGPARLLFVSRLTTEKGAVLMADALAKLADPAWELVIAGQGPQEADLRAALARTGLLPRARFAGHLCAARLAEEYAACDIVVMPSLQPESFGLVGIEALAFGKPVVGFAAGGMGEWLRHEQTGLVARHGDAADLAAQLVRLMSDADLRRRLGQRGRALVTECYGLEAHLAELLSIYRERGVLARAGAS